MSQVSAGLCAVLCCAVHTSKSDFEESQISNRNHISNGVQAGTSCKMRSKVQMCCPISAICDLLSLTIAEKDLSWLRATQAPNEATTARLFLPSILHHNPLHLFRPTCNRIQPSFHSLLRTSNTDSQPLAQSSCKTSAFSYLPRSVYASYLAFPGSLFLRSL